MAEQALHPTDRVEDRLEFETLIADTSAAVFAATPDQVERAVELALERVAAFFQADACALLQVSADTRRVGVQIAFFGEGVPRVGSDVNLAEVYPWTWRKVVLERVPVRVTSMASLPPGAETDRPAWAAMGIRSVLILPVEAGADVRHLIVIYTSHRECDWPDALTARLRLLGELLVGALERNAMLAELREAEARVSVAADSAGAGLWVLDYRTGVFWATERARAVFGYAPDEEVTLARLRESVHPDDWNLVRDALERPRPGREPVSVDYRIVLGDGRVRWISSRGRFHLGAGGEPQRLTGASTDVTERRQAEEAFRRNEARLASGAELAGLAFYEVDFERGVAWVDARFREICGLPPERERGLEPVHHWMEHLHPDDRPRVTEMRARFHDGRADQASVEYRYRHPARGEVWIHHLGRVARRDATGHAVVTYGVLRDVTDRKRADGELADLSRQLIRAHEDERAMLARELHDDVTQRLAILAIDVGRAEVAASDEAHAEKMRAVREGLARLSEDVHALAYQLHPSVLDELGLVEALRTTCERFEAKGSVALSLDADPVPAGLGRDAALCVFRVAQEALNNVARHARARAASVTLRSAGDGLLLTVRDDGIGFDPAHPPRRSLGLASMRERVGLLNGTLEVQSAPGGGSAVVAWIPTAAGGSP
jgi:PAS domain S-box-containing protein